MRNQFYNPANNSYVASGNVFTIGDNQYPANWLDLASAEEIAEIGLLPVKVIGERGDDRYHDNAEVLSGDTLMITATRKPIEFLRAAMRDAIKA